MPKFIVLLSRDCVETEEAEAVVEAKNQAEARRIARDRVDRDKLYWRKVDFSSETDAVSVSLAHPDEDLSAFEE